MKLLSFILINLSLFQYCFASNIVDNNPSNNHKHIAQDKTKDSNLHNINEAKQRKKQTHKMLLSHVDQQNFKSEANIQILNKVTNVVYEYKIKINKKFIFDNLYFTVSKCWQAPLDQIPESKVLIDIDLIQEGQKDKKPLFYGWLFASSPASSGLEHPIYDVTAIKCS